MLTKKNVLVISGLISGIFVIFDRIGTFRLCGGVEYGACMDNLHNFMGEFLPVFPIFFLSVIVYFFREEVFRAWITFTYIWIPLTMFLILIAPEYGNAFFPIEKGTVAGFFSLLYIIISLIIIIWKYFATRKREEE